MVPNDTVADGWHSPIVQDRNARRTSRRTRRAAGPGFDWSLPGPGPFPGAAPSIAWTRRNGIAARCAASLAAHFASSRGLISRPPGRRPAHMYPIASPQQRTVCPPHGTSEAIASRLRTINCRHSIASATTSPRPSTRRAGRKPPRPQPGTRANNAPTGANATRLMPAVLPGHSAAVGASAIRGRHGPLRRALVLACTFVGVATDSRSSRTACRERWRETQGRRGATWQRASRGPRRADQERTRLVIACPRTTHARTPTTPPRVSATTSLTET